MTKYRCCSCGWITETEEVMKLIICNCCLDEMIEVEE